MTSINNISGHLNSTTDIFIFANNSSGGYLGMLMVFALFLIVLFTNIQVDGVKKRLAFASISTFTVAILFFLMGFITSYVLVIYVAASIVSLVWVAFFD